LRTVVIDNSVIPFFLREGEKTARCLPGDVRRVSGVHDTLPTLLDFDRLIVTGSEASVLADDDWIKRQADLVSYAVLAGKHVLGICFGHQLLARALWGKDHVWRTARAEFGWYPVALDVAEPLFEDLPQRAYWFCSHYDEVHDPPAAARVLAHSESCGVQAFQVAGFPSWGIQFHPEFWGPHAHLMLAAMTLHDKMLVVAKQSAPSAATAAERARRLFVNFWRQMN